MTATTLHQTIGGTHVRRASEAWVRRGPLHALPIAVVVPGFLALSGFPTGRILVLLLLFGFISALQLGLARIMRKTPTDVRLLVGVSAAYLVLLGAAMAVTGGLASPFGSLLLARGVMSFSLYGRSRSSDFLFALAAGVAGVLALLPSPWTGPPIAAPFGVLSMFFCLVYALLLSRFATFSLSDAHRQTGASRDRLREDVFAAVTARARTLESISTKIAHELKNPLTAVKALAQLLARGTSDEQSKLRLRVISAEVTRMGDILSDYLSFSRPLDDLRPEPTDLAALCSDVFAVLEARAVHAGVVASLYGDCASVVADPRRIKEAFLNLIANAIEATPESGTVEVEITSVDDGATVTVRDSGRGMSPEELARVGTPFFTTRDGGTGLGVVLARAVVIQHGGEMSYTSEVGRGTTVTVRLPAEPPRSPP